MTPEAALGGPLALVEDGDRIVIDVDRRTVDLDVAEGEVATATGRSSRELYQAALAARSVSP